MEGARDRQDGPLGVVSVTLKNPTRVQQEGFKLTVNRTITLKEFKKKIGMVYPGRPEPSDVTVGIWFIRQGFNSIFLELVHIFLILH